MKPIQIYTLTRIADPEGMERLERQMSKRKGYLKIKEWETAGLRALCDNLFARAPETASYEFYYSFTMPKLGKEFDLLRIAKNCVVNIELKSGNVSEAAIKQQLIQNRYYLSSLERTIYSFTYISSEDRLVRLSGGGRLIDTDVSDLLAILQKQQHCEHGDIEELFREEKFLISPLTAPDKFLRQDYFLTAGQLEIKKKLLREILQKPGTVKREFSIHGFTGLPGTGKTILLYDIAMELSVSERVCVLHLGSFEEELLQLDQRLKRVDFYHCEPAAHISLRENYAALLVDEGHRLTQAMLGEILLIARTAKIPVIISYDKEDTIAREERAGEGAELIEAEEGFIGYKLTDRIRLNGELSSFISCLMCVTRAGRKYDFPSVSIAYAKTGKEAAAILQTFQNKGYMYIYDRELEGDGMADLKDGAEKQQRDGAEKRQKDGTGKRQIEAKDATCKEFDRVVMKIDETFTYDRDGYLRDHRMRAAGRESVVRNLFHGLNRAKKQIGIVVEGNEELFYRILGILQRRPTYRKHQTAE